MARLLLSKATLSAQRQKLAAYQRFLPALDMKRQQLQGAIKQVEVQQQELVQQRQQLAQRIGEQMPMLAVTSIDLKGLCTVRSLQLRRRNIVGVWINELEAIDFDLAIIPLMAKPHWVAPLQQWLQEGMTLDVKHQLLQQQHRVMAAALRKVTQRVNLFDKVLIPETRSNIRRIGIYLDDKDRESVVTSKIAKNKRQAAGGS
ncbi:MULTISPECIES: V-type ATP synthase subunit D [unclassified Oceanobacter]|uniref:V-type ATP synthase subunit D n=1 Tax=unclassified Oceanobacter TaxID=2620260 RepID=UPI00273739EF|nr:MULTISPECIES: V-type ATP synthase subunit D [unclassified Oceanobacter]MDP2608188.1 V-type ATP synthase subunit D [Oceanobacter sp. 1_MG-2023]MDP2612914.1 V-type ATP synthase subunit D [Oceanobacter sp. 2_MG-2023]